MSAGQEKFPAEIFGVHWRDKSAAGADIRDKKMCRFAGGQCDKKGHVFNPFGVCSAQVGGENIPLCPKRMTEGWTVFQSIARLHFGTQNNVAAFPEVGARGIGNFDFVLVRHAPAGAMSADNFAVIEIQGGQTSNTGHLTRAYSDLLRDGEFQPAPPYNFTINHYDLWKRSLIQLLTKGAVMEKWGTKIYWVVPKQLFAYFQSRYLLGDLKYDASHNTVFALCDLEEKGEKLVLTGPEWCSAAVDQLFHALRHNLQAPSLEEFRANLEKRMKDPLKLRFRIFGE